MKRFVFLLATIFLVLTGCDLANKDLLKINLEDALVSSEDAPAPCSVDWSWLMFSQSRSNGRCTIHLNIPETLDHLDIQEDDEFYKGEDYYLVRSEDGYIKMALGETPYIRAYFRNAYSSDTRLEYSPNRKTAQQIKKVLDKYYVFIPAALVPEEVAIPIEEAVETFEDVAVPIEEEEAVEEEGMLMGNASSPRLFQEVDDVPTNRDRELYVGAYTSATTGIVKKFFIYEDWMLEHFDPDVEPRKYFYKGMTTYEGKTYRYYKYDDENYILVSPDTNNLIKFWTFTFDGNKSNNVTRYDKGDLSSPSAQNVYIDNSYQQLQQQQYYQQQQKMQREQMYLSQYRTWENNVISNWNTLTSMREGAARVSVRMNFRNAQSQMRQVRMNAQVEGIHIPASAWESASVPLGYE